MSDLCVKSRRWARWILPIGLALAALGPSASEAAVASAFGDWHLPFPAGSWAIVGAPCDWSNGEGRNCRTYEFRCALDLAPIDPEGPPQPVISAAAGEVFFVGYRSELGQTVLVRHPDGRATAYSNLTRVTVAQGDLVKAGGPLGFVGGQVAERRFLRFSIFPDVVQRSCLLPTGLDGVAPGATVATSRNLPFGSFRLVQPDSELLLSLPPVEVTHIGQIVKLDLVVSPEQFFKIPVLLQEDALGLRKFGVVMGGTEVLWASSLGRTAEGARFLVPIRASYITGQDSWTLATGEAMAEHAFELRFEVANPTTTIIRALLDNPDLTRPTSYSRHQQAPELCWGRAYVGYDSVAQYRVIVAGQASADSGWLAGAVTEMCWRPERLDAGLYYWKVFVRDRWGRVNRTHDYPWAFIVQP